MLLLGLLSFRAVAKAFPCCFDLHLVYWQCWNNAC